MTDVLRHARPSARVRGGFAWLTRRMIRKSFHAVRITPEGAELFRSAALHPGPVLLVANHGSWWDPLIALRLAGASLGHRPLAAPIEMRQYERFGILRQLGLFGIQPQDPDSLPAMINHLRDRIATDGNPLICITPQGQFADVREPVRLRPGAAAVAAAFSQLKVITLALEYGFWQDKRPELFLHALPAR